MEYYKLVIHVVWMDLEYRCVSLTSLKSPVALLCLLQCPVHSVGTRTLAVFSLFTLVQEPSPSVIHGLYPKVLFSGLNRE